MSKKFKGKESGYSGYYEGKSPKLGLKAKHYYIVYSL